MKKILLVSHCLLNTASKLKSYDESEMKAEDSLRKEIIKTAVDNDIHLLQLPCPEFLQYGYRRWGHTYDQFNNVFFRERCREMLQPVILQVKEYLETLKASGNAYWHMARLPELVWDAHTALYGRLMQCAARLRQGGAAGDVVEHLESARFLWERTLDLPFGSMEIVRADEALQAIHQAVKHVNHLPGEQN